MVFHWQCDLAPFLSDSGSSRYLITTVPTTAYVYDQDVNITLQSVAQHICRSLADLRISIPMTCIDSDPCLVFCLCGPPLLCQKPASIDPKIACSPWRYGVHCLQGCIYDCVRDGVQGWLEVPVPIVQLGSHSNFGTGRVIETIFKYIQSMGGYLVVFKTCDEKIRSKIFHFTWFWSYTSNVQS